MKFVVLGLGIALLGIVGTASAALCPKCAGMMYTADVGTCTKCGGHTSSGAFRLCGKCSGNLHQCEHCLAALGTPASKVGGTRPPEAAPGEKAEAKTDALELSAGHDGKTVTVAPGKDVVVRLAGNITTGYGWKVGKITGEAVKSQGDPAYVPAKAPQGMVGRGGMFVIKLQAVKPGKSTVKLVYARPWEKDQPPAKTFTATIEVQEK